MGLHWSEGSAFWPVKSFLYPQPEIGGSSQRADIALWRCMNPFLLVATGGALGAVARYGAGLVALRLAGAAAWPWGTFAVNLIGGLLIGLVTGWIAFKSSATSESVRLFAVVGVLGGFTTFSAFSLELVAMLERREMATAILYALASVILSVVAVFVGLTIMRKVFG